MHSVQSPTNGFDLSKHFQTFVGMVPTFVGMVPTFVGMVPTFVGMVPTNFGIVPRNHSDILPSIGKTLNDVLY